VKPDEKKSFLLRVDTQLWNEIQGWAAQELRSVNGQIEYILKEAVAKRRLARTPPPKSRPGE